MAEELLRSRHAFGSESGISAAIEAGKIDAYDILFLSEGKIGWIDKNNQPVILNDHTGVEVVDTLPESGEEAVIYIFENKGYVWNGSEFVPLSESADISDLKAEIAKKADAEDVEKIEFTLNDCVSELNSFEVSYEKIKYEISDTPIGTLVDYRDKEIRIMCPENAVWSLQNVGAGGDANTYYMTLRTYAPNDDAVGYIKHLGDQVDPEILTNLYTDKYGRKYQPTWLGLAQHDEATDTWTYYGANSTEEHFVGWDYRIDWYNADCIMIASDKIRINLSNENCHSSIEPSYMIGMVNEEEVGAMITEATTGFITEKQVSTIVEEAIAEATVSVEVVEF